MKNLLFMLALGLPLVSGLSAVKAGDILPAPTQVSKHVYAWIGPHGPPRADNKGFRMNMAFVVGGESVAVIESGYTKPMAREMLAHIAKITDKPVKYVINSNSRPDRYFGNDVFEDQGARTIAHKLEIDQMRRLNSSYELAAEAAMGAAANIRAPRLPKHAISEPMSIDLGGLTIKINPFPKAHTPAPLVVYIAADNVVYAGDILYSGRMLAVVDGGDAASWMKAYKNLEKFGNATFVLGHGDPSVLDGFAHSTYAYLQTVNAHMAKAVDEEIDMQDAIKTLDQSAWRALADSEALSGRNAQKVYIEYEAAAFE